MLDGTNLIVFIANTHTTGWPPLNCAINRKVAGSLPDEVIGVLH
jgi:hypothetical protein